MSGFKVELDPRFFEKLTRNMAKERDAMIQDIGTKLQADIVTDITKKGLVGVTGHYRDSIQLDFRKSDKGALAIVGSNMLYALPIEYGITKKFFPNMDMVLGLESWVKKKGIGPSKPSKASGFVLGYLKMDKPKGESYLNTAAAVALKIGRTAAIRGFPKRFGTRGARVFETAFLKASKYVPGIVERFVRRAAALTEVFK